MFVRSLNSYFVSKKTLHVEWLAEAPLCTLASPFCGLHFHVSLFTALPCNKQPAPRNGYLQCIKKPPSQDIICWMECKPGYDVTFLPAEYYVCNDNGTWVTPSGGPKFTKWPDCVVYKWVLIRLMSFLGFSFSANRWRLTSKIISVIKQLRPQGLLFWKPRRPWRQGCHSNTDGVMHFMFVSSCTKYIMQYKGTPVPPFIQILTFDLLCFNLTSF